MKNQKTITWDDIRAIIKAETSKILQETNQQIKKERMRMEEEKKREREEREKEKVQMEEEKKREKEEEKKRKKEEREEDKKFNKERKKFLDEFKQYGKTHREAIERMKVIDKKYEKTWEQIGGISRSNGEFCEEYFINTLKENPILLGEKFDRVLDYLKPDPVVINDEYDLVMRNGTTIALVEMKYKAGINDVGKMFSKLHTYRTNYPMFKDYKIYLCLASFRFPKNVKQKAADDGIVLIQQRGEKIEIISENVRAW